MAVRPRFWQRFAQPLVSLRGRLAPYLPSESQHIFGLTLVIGVLCGLAAVAFHLAIRASERALIDRAMAAPGLSWIGWTLLTPTLGGLAAGLALHFVVPLARGSGVPQVKQAYALQGGRLRLRDTVGKFLIGSLQIGSGASLGREGPTVQICAGVASALGRATLLPEKSIRRLVPVGVAAGIAAAFNAPIAAVTFTIEEIVGNLDQTVLSGVVVAAALAAVIERSVLGTHPVIEVAQHYGLEHASSLVFYVVLGLAAAFVSVAFTDSLLAIRARFKRLHTVPAWAHPAIGGLATGALAVAAFALLGTKGVTGGGYETLASALSGQLGVRVLLALCGIKLVATVASYSSGGAGGIFAPALFIGAMLGGVVGYTDIAALGHSSSELGAFALVGMGAVFAGIIRAPITSVLIIFEMTGGYGLVLPLMIANMISYGFARRWRPTPIYEALLEQDGVRIPRHLGAVTHALENLQVHGAMTRDPVALPAAATVAEALSALEGRTFSTIPVLDGSNRYIGLVPALRLREASAKGDTARSVSDFLSHTESIASDQPLIRAVIRMNELSVRQLGVVDPAEGSRLVGIVAIGDVLRAHARAATDPSEPMLRRLRVREVMTQGREFVVFSPRTTSVEMLRHLGDATWQDVFPVMDDGKMVGLVTVDAMRVVASDRGDTPWAIAADIMQRPICVSPHDDLRTATQCLLANGLREIPVADETGAVVGFLDEREVAKIYLTT